MPLWGIGFWGRRNSSTKNISAEHSQPKRFKLDSWWLGGGAPTRLCLGQGAEAPSVHVGADGTHPDGYMSVCVVLSVLSALMVRIPMATCLYVWCCRCCRP